MVNQASGLTASTQADSPPVFFSVVGGEPTQTELAALVAVLSARARAAAAEMPVAARTPRSCWSDRSRLMRASLVPGPDAWRRSALPR